MRRYALPVIGSWRHQGGGHTIGWRRTDAAGIVADYPFSIFSWFWAYDSGYLAVLGATNPTGDQQTHRLQHASTTITVGSTTTTDTSAQGADITSKYGGGGWHSALGVWTSATDRRAYVDGRLVAVGTTNRSPNTPYPTFTVGCSSVATPSAGFQGSLLWPALWDIALGPDAAVALHLGAAPLDIAPSRLVHFLADFESGKCFASGADFTLVKNTSTQPAMLSRPELPIQLAHWQRQRIYSFASLAAGGLQITPSAHSNSQVYGTARLDLSLAPSAHVNSQAFGTAALNLNVTPAAHVNSSSFGLAMVTVIGNVPVNPSAHVNSQAFGTARLDLGLALTALVNSQLYGTTLVRPDLRLLPSSLASSNAFGTAALHLNVNPTAHVNAQAYGTTVVSLAGSLSVTPSSMVNLSTFGTSQLDLALPLTAFANSQAYGTTFVQASTVTIEAPAIGSSNVFGTTSIRMSIEPTSLVSSQAYGTTLVRVDQLVQPEGFVSTKVFGNAVITGGAEPPPFVPNTQPRVVNLRLSVR